LSPVVQGCCRGCNERHAKVAAERGSGLARGIESILPAAWNALQLHTHVTIVSVTRHASDHGIAPSACATAILKQDRTARADSPLWHSSSLNLAALENVSKFEISIVDYECILEHELSRSRRSIPRARTLTSRSVFSHLGSSNHSSPLGGEIADNREAEAILASEREATRHACRDIEGEGHPRRCRGRGESPIERLVSRVRDTCTPLHSRARDARRSLARSRVVQELRCVT